MDSSTDVLEKIMDINESDENGKDLGETKPSIHSIVDADVQVNGGGHVDTVDTSPHATTSDYTAGDEDDDAFGDFVEPPTTATESSNGMLATSDDIVAPSPTDPGLHVEVDAAIESIVAHVPQPTAQNRTEPDLPSDDVVPVQQEDSMGLLEGGGDAGGLDMDESFGDFEGAGVPAASPASLLPTEGEVRDDVTAGLPPSKSDEPVSQRTDTSVHDGTGTTVGSHDDCAEGESPMTTSADDGHVLVTNTHHNPNNSLDERGGEVFSEPTSSAAIVEASHLACATAAVDDDDDVGDLGGAAAAMDVVGDHEDVVKETQTHPEADGVQENEVPDTDKGDMTGRLELDNSPAPHPTPVSPEGDPSENVNDDDFGDFGAAPVLDPAPHVTGDDTGGDEDDAFGDFDNAPSLGQMPNGVGGGDVVEDLDDDDVGDFDAAPVMDPTPGAALGEELDDDFGDFDSAPDNGTTGPVPTQQQEGPTDAKLDLVQRAKSTFSRLFRMDDSVPVESQAGDANPLCESPTISEFLASCVADSQARRSSRVYPSLESILNDHSDWKKMPPRTIAIDDGRGTFSHFSLPYSRRGTRRLRRRASGSQSRPSVQVGIPEVLDIRLPSPSDRPIDMASPVVESRRKVHAMESRGDVPPSTCDVAKPADDAGMHARSGEVNHQPAQSVQDFLRRIPDLSFMLSSTFVAAPRNNS